MTTVSSAEEAYARRIECREDGMYFNRFFFKQRYGANFEVGRHHPVMQAALDRTMLPPNDKQFIPRLIINLPPGYTKTEQGSIGYMARGLALNAMSRFLHLSYSAKLALLNSAATREIVTSAQFQQMWPIEIKADINSKNIWHTTKIGGVTASSSAGQVPGFRGGHMDPTRFTGAVILDDPLKPDDAYSELTREGVNNNYNETIMSRVAIDENPIILIMQRVHWNDLSGFLLRGGSGEKWHHLLLPVIIDNSKAYPKEYTHGTQIDHGLADGWLWPFKHREKHRVVLQAARRKYAAQYKQDPLKRDQETALWKEKQIAKARDLDLGVTPSKRTVVAVDPATTNNPKSDEHGIIVASEYPFPKHNKYSLDADYTRKGSPLQWAEAAISAYDQHNADSIIIETNQGGDMCVDTLVNAGFEGRIIRIHAKKGKYLRAEPVVALYELGYISHLSGLSDTEEEMMDFDPVTQLSNGKSPNRVDAAVYAISELAGVGMTMESLLEKALGD